MNEITSVKGLKAIKVRELSSKPHASIETIQDNKEIQTTGMREIQKFKSEMNHAFALVNQIRSELERAYQDLSPPE